MHTHTHTHTHTSHICTRTHMHTDTHTSTHIHTQTHTYIHTHTHTCTHRHTHMHTHAHTHTVPSTHKFILTCDCIASHFRAQLVSMSSLRSYSVYCECHSTNVPQIHTHAHAQRGTLNVVTKLETSVTLLCTYPLYTSPNEPLPILSSLVKSTSGSASLLDTS